MNNIVVAFGRMNPMHIGHELVCKTMQDTGYDAKLYLSHKTGPKDPLDYDTKIEWAHRAFDKYVDVVNSNAKSFLEALSELYDQYGEDTNLYFVAGSDQSNESKVVMKYNGVEGKPHGYYKFKSITPKQAGNDRAMNEDDINVEGASGTNQRAYAEADDLESFMAYCPTTLTDDEKEDLFNDVRKGMGLFESLDEINEEDLWTLGISSVVYRGESSSRFVNEHKNEYGLFFTKHRGVASEYGDVARYEMDSRINLCDDYNSSYDCCVKNNLKHGKRFDDWAINQKSAKDFLEAQGYDGAVWSYEDQMDPYQFQIWNLDMIDRIGYLKDLEQSKEESYKLRCDSMGLLEALDELHEAEAVRQLTKTSLQKPEVQADLKQELQDIEPGFKVPDPNKDLVAYKQDPDDYQGLYVKQGTSDKSVCYNVKDVANYAQEKGVSDPKDSVQDIANIVVQDNKGNNYKMYNSGASISAKGSARSANVTLGSNLQDLQEAIQAALLMNLVKIDGDVMQFLLNSDPIKKTGIFKVVITPEVTQENLNLFKEEWLAFLKVWKASFINCVNNQQTLLTAIKTETNDGKGIKGPYITLHQAIRNEYTKAVSPFFNNHAKDEVDKSDFYIYSAAKSGNIEKDFNELYNRIGDHEAYIEYWSKIKDRLIGVSLKKSAPNKQRINFDEPPILWKDFSKYVTWKVADGDKESNKLEFVVRDYDEDVVLLLNNRSSGKPKAIEFQFYGEQSQAGKAKDWIRVYFANGDKIADLCNAGKFTASTKLIVDEITDDLVKAPKKGGSTKFIMSTAGRKLMSDLFNKSCGRSSSESRTSVPFIKVH